MNSGTLCDKGSRSGAFSTPRLEEEQEKSHLVGWNFTLCLQASGGPGATAEA